MKHFPAAYVATDNSIGQGGVERGCRPGLWGWIIIEFCKRLTWTEKRKGEPRWVMSCPARGLWKDFIFKYEIEVCNERCKLTCDTGRWRVYISLLSLFSFLFLSPLSPLYLSSLSSSFSPCLISNTAPIITLSALWNRTSSTRRTRWTLGL